MDMAAAPKNGRRLVGKNLLYAISIFASLGVFLVRVSCVLQLAPRLTHGRL